MAQFSPKSLAASLVHANTRVFGTQTDKDTQRCIYVSGAFLSSSGGLGAVSGASLPRPGLSGGLGTVRGLGDLGVAHLRTLRCWTHTGLFSSSLFCAG